MHIGFLTPEYSMSDTPDGGLANYLKKVCRDLTLRDHEVSVFCASKESGYQKDGSVNLYYVEKPRFLRFVGRFSSIKKYSIFLRQLLYAKNFEKAVWKVHKNHPLNILHVSSYRSPGYTLLQNGKIPLVCRVSSYSPLVRSAYGKQKTFDDYLSDWLEVKQIRDSEASFTPSVFLAKELNRIEAIYPSVIRTPIESNFIQCDASFYRDNLAGRQYLLFFGTLSRIKGVDLLATIIPKVLSRFHDLSFVFVGRDAGLPNGQKVFDFLCEQCSECVGNLLYFQPLTKPKLYPIISNAIGVLIPSRVDNYPNACLEAMALGVPVIGSDESSLEEMIDDGRTGFLARNGDPDSLLQAIFRLLKLSTEQRQQLKENISCDINNISVDDRIKQLVNFYEDVIENFDSEQCKKC